LIHCVSLAISDMLNTEQTEYDDFTVCICFRVCTMSQTWYYYQEIKYFRSVCPRSAILLRVAGAELFTQADAFH